MTKADFVDRIRRAVYEPVIEGTSDLLQNPPGRKPSQTLVTASWWFKQLPTDQREQVQAIIRLAVRHAIFSMLTVLDGLTSIRYAGEKGTLELRYVVDNESVLLNNPHGECLHDLFAEQVPPE